MYTGTAKAGIEFHTEALKRFPDSQYHKNLLLRYKREYNKIHTGNEQEIK